MTPIPMYRSLFFYHIWSQADILWILGDQLTGNYILNRFRACTKSMPQIRKESFTENSLPSSLCDWSRAVGEK